MQINWQSPDATFFSPLQSTAGETELVLSEIHKAVPGVQRTVSFTSAFDNSGINLTLGGVTIYGEEIGETVVGPNAETIETVNEYHQLYIVTCSDSITAVSVGTGTGGLGIFALNNENPYFKATIDTGVSGTVDYSLTRTSFNPQSDESVYFPIDSALTNATANQTWSLDQVSSAVKVVFDKDPANTGSVDINLVQQGI